ncbi:uncharacterized protein Dwil_GK12031 [Drosophila willistoni]|uniref:Uncharacterized protein n=1 Tax=Drosophila willistoni TaxID=7260 RepID=A0A0Q9WT64_DROWI|nr:uncharacterized protein Dwil_GK12031 [Drosophila willistoni]
MDLDPSMENVCRVCRDGSVTLVDIFNGVDAEEDHEKNLAHVLSQCTNCQVNPDDLLPKQICLSCVLAAQNAFRFKKTCEQSHQYFCEILEMRWQTQHRSQAEELVFNDDDVHMAGGLHVIDVSCIKMEPMSELQELAMPENVPMEIPSTEEQVHTTDEVFPHICQYCTKGFRGTYELDNHIRSRHTTERPFECPQCHKKFATLSFLRNHTRLHTGQRPYKCPHCPEEFTLWSSIKAHISEHEGSQSNKSTKQFRCDQCAASFREHFGLRMHKQLKHRISNTIADAQSRTPYDSLPNSVLEENNAQDANYCCDICKKTFKYRYAYTNHKRAHIRALRTYHCPYSQCSQCIKGFYKKSQLTNHMRDSHSGDRIECSQCQQKFASKASLRVHINIFHSEDFHHLSTAPQMEQANDLQRPIKTEVPDSNLPHESLLVEQIQTRNSPHESLLVEQILPDQDFKFAIMDYLGKHIRIHSGERPFKCPHCPKSYTLSSSLSGHIRKHHGNSRNLITKQFRCNQCLASFREYFKLRMHKQLKHCINDTMAKAKSLGKLKQSSTNYPGTNTCNVSLPNLVLEEGNLEIKKEPAEEDTEPTPNQSQQPDTNYSCEICDKKFKYSYAYNNHIRTHMRRQQFKCSQCQRTFLMKHGIKDDEEREEELILDHQPMNFGLDHETNIPLRNRPGDGAYEELEFEDSDSKKDILNPNPILIPQTHIQLPNVEKNVTKNNVCPYCLKRYVRKESLTVHMRRHTGERPYKCPYCVMSFSSNDSYKRHLRGHTGDLFRCDKCPKVYKCRSDLRFHQNQKHKVPKEEPIVLTKHLIVRLKRIKLPVSVKVEPIA